MKLILDYSHFDDFLKTRFVSGSFLQSSLWQKFLDKQGLKYWRVSVLEDEEPVATCLFYEKKLPLDRSYLYAPKGPITNTNFSIEKQKQAIEMILSKVRDVTIDTKKQEEIFFRLELENKDLLLAKIKKTPDIHPRDTWVIDLCPDLKTLLANMHAKSRYNIALANKHSVKIRFSQDIKDLGHFLALTKKTAQRNKIVVHADSYYEKLFKTLIENNSGELALAFLDSQVIAANLLLHFSKATTYLHGASDYNFRKYMAPHLLQWESIKRSKESGQDIYDFWGIAPQDNTKPTWEGITRFKKYFGGRAIYSAGTYDLVYNSHWYNLYNLGVRLRYLFK